MRTRDSENQWINTTPLGTSSTGTVYRYSEPWHAVCSDETHEGPPYRTGGPLTITKTTVTRKPSPSRLFTGLVNRWYNGGFIPAYRGANPTSVNPLFMLTEDLYLPSADAMGAKGWNKFKPGKPGVDLGQFIGELRQIPSLPRLRETLRDFRRLGSEYLNVEFGWKPFLRDLRDAVLTATDIHRRLEQLRRDNGKPIRRGGTVATNQSSTITTAEDSLYPILTSEYYSDPLNIGQRETISLSTERHWFKARFRYWIPDIDSPAYDYRHYVKLFGLNPSPALLWELLPWSWLVDWGSNVGDIMSNLSGNAADNLVAEYAYGMSSRIIEENTTARATVRSRVFQDGAWRTIGYRIRCESNVKWELKLRKEANPYGFGLTYADLSDRQMLILSALGLARSR